MSEPTLFPLPDPDPHMPDVYPEWYTPSKHTKTNNAAVARGLHPFGLPLYPDESKTCGDCEHAEPSHFNDKTYWKCAIAKQSKGPGTDLRQKWRACAKWESYTPDHLRPDAWILVVGGQPVKVFHRRDTFPLRCREDIDALVRVGSDYGQVLVDKMIEAGTAQP